MFFCLGSDPFAATFAVPVIVFEETLDYGIHKAQLYHTRYLRVNKPFRLAEMLSSKFRAHWRAQVDMQPSHKFMLLFTRHRRISKTEPYDSSPSG